MFISVAESYTANSETARNTINTGAVSFEPLTSALRESVVDSCYRVSHWEGSESSLRVRLSMCTCIMMSGYSWVGRGDSLQVLILKYFIFRGVSSRGQGVGGTPTLVLCLFLKSLFCWRGGGAGSKNLRAVEGDGVVVLQRVACRTTIDSLSFPPTVELQRFKQLYSSIAATKGFVCVLVQVGIQCCVSELLSMGRTSKWQASQLCMHVYVTRKQTSSARAFDACHTTSETD